MAAAPYPAWDGFAPRLALPDGGYALSGLRRIAPRLALPDGGCALSGLRRIALLLALPDGGCALSGLQRFRYVGLISEAPSGIKNATFPRPDR
jgi:hypothetical protein